MLYIGIVSSDGTTDLKCRHSTHSTPIDSKLASQVNSLGRPRGSDDSDDESTEASDPEDDLSDGRKAALQALLKGEALPEDTPTKGLFGLPFMQRAMQRKEAEVCSAAEELLREMGGGAAVPSGRMRFETTAWGDGDRR